MEYAGFWRRFAAQLIDEILLWVVAYTLAGIVVLALTTAGRLAAPEAAFVFNGISLLGGLLIAVIYFVYAEGRYGMTVGKKLMNIKLVRIDQPNRDGVGYGRALVRFLAACALRVLVNISFVWMLIDRHGRTLHDHAAGTIVVHDHAGQFASFDPDTFLERPTHRVWFGVVVAITVLATVIQFLIAQQTPLP